MHVVMKGRCSTKGDLDIPLLPPGGQLGHDALLACFTPEELNEIERGDGTAVLGEIGASTGIARCGRR